MKICDKKSLNLERETEKKNLKLEWDECVKMLST